MTVASPEPRVVRFRGRVACGRGGDGPLGLVLVGRTEDRPDEAVHVSFSCPAPADLPAELDDAKLELLGNNRHRLTSGDRSWALQGAVHIHREILTLFYQAIPPRPVPLRKRLFWRVMLGVAANSLTRRLLLRGR